MAKAKRNYVCENCGSVSSKWSGQCSDCLAWNTFVEQKARLADKGNRRGNYSGLESNTVINLTEVAIGQQFRQLSGIAEFDRVLGGGIVNGSAILIGGDPGIGKSTLLLQILSAVSVQKPVLYVTGEESLEQVAMRAQRLGLPYQAIQALSETCVEEILQHADRVKPAVVVIDSIQTVFSQEISSCAGSVSQIRECAALLVQYAKKNQTAVFLVGHVTKEGALAGPRVLEHIVDTVLYFEGQKDSRYRLIRAIKNRFGAVNELGIFAMTDKGLKEVNNPSAIFLTRGQEPVPGSVVMTTWEGTRPMLVEVQALVDQTVLGNPRRVTVGIDANRLTICLAVLHRHGGIQTYDQDVFVNVVGGVRVTETAADLAMCLAVLSSLKNKPLSHDLMIFGEVGLAGEVRPVQGGSERLREAHKHGFKKAIVPKANAKHVDLADLTIRGISTLDEALEAFDE